MTHGEKINITINGVVIPGHIEERLLGQWPEKRTGLFVCVDDGMPHFPIPICHFQPDQKDIYQYGTIESQQTKG